MRLLKIFLPSFVLLLLPTFFVFTNSNQVPLSSPGMLIGVFLACVGFMGLVQTAMLFLSQIGLPQPVANQPAMEKTELVAQLLALNSPDSPFQVIQRGDRIICSWKVADAEWYEFFAKVKMKYNYQLQFLLVDDKKAVRAIEVTTQYTNTIGSSLSFALFAFRGWIPFQYQVESGWGVVEIFPLTLGKIYSLNFQPQKLRAPLLQIIVNAGWKIEPCTLSLALGI